jgi:hypothetical protein
MSWILDNTLSWTHHPYSLDMFALIKFAGQTRILNIWRPANPLQFSPASAISIRRKSAYYSDNPVTRREQYDRNNAVSRERYARDRVFREQRKENARATKKKEERF